MTLVVAHLFSKYEALRLNSKYCQKPNQTKTKTPVDTNISQVRKAKG
jgi:hypothetical protein